MGQSISFFRNNTGRGIRELLTENFPDFRQWYLDQEKESVQVFGEHFGRVRFLNFLNAVSLIQPVFDGLDKTILDELTSEFFGNILDLEPEGFPKMELIGPMVSGWRYLESSKMVEATKDAEFLRLWNFLIRGRSLKDDSSFDRTGGWTAIGFLNQTECEILRNKIHHCFGDQKNMKQKYWTDEEREKYKKAFAASLNGTISLSGHNPVSSGLEMVLDVMDEAGENYTELISVIE